MVQMIKMAADADYDVITLDYTFGNVNVLVGQVDYDADADYSYFEISGSLGQIAGVDASLTSLVLLMSLMHVLAAKWSRQAIQSLSVLAKRSIYKLI